MGVERNAGQLSRLIPPHVSSLKNLPILIYFNKIQYGTNCSTFLIVGCRTISTLFVCTDQDTVIACLALRILPFIEPQNTSTSPTPWRRLIGLWRRDETNCSFLKVFPDFIQNEELLFHDNRLQHQDTLVCTPRITFGPRYQDIAHDRNFRYTGSMSRINEIVLTVLQRKGSNSKTIRTHQYLCFYWTVTSWGRLEMGTNFSRPRTTLLSLKALT